MHFVKFHPEVASCLLSRGKRKYAPLGMRLLWKYILNYFLVYQLTSHFLLYLQNYKEFEAEILDLQSEKYGLSFDIKKYTTSGWALGDENVIGIRAFKNIFGSGRVGEFYFGSVRVGEFYFGSVRVGVFFFTGVWDIFSWDFGDKLTFHSQTEEVEWLLSLISTLFDVITSLQGIFTCLL